MQAWMQQSFHISGIDFAGRVPPGAGTPVHRDRRAHGLVLQVGGSTQYAFLGEKTFTLNAGDVIYLPKGADYDVCPTETADCYCINFQTMETLTAAPFTLHAAGVAHYLKLFQDAEHFHHSRQPARHDMVLSCLYAVIHQLKSEYFRTYTPSSRMVLLQPALDYIDRNYAAESISIAALAAMCGISAVHFRNTFRAVYGMSPLSYIHELKLTRARQLLLSSNEPLHVIAEKCGFASDSVFSRTFKKATGLSPSDYRKHL